MRACEEAYDRGYERGQDAASWYFDGNTNEATARRVLAGILDGDPEVLDTFPAFMFGEWAGDSMNELLGDLANDDSDIYADTLDGLADSYLQGFDDAVVFFIEREARMILDGEGED